MNKILIVHASFGHGHKKAAQALADYFNTPCYDILDFTHPFLKTIYSYSYEIITQYLPFIWQLAFVLTRNKFLSLILNKCHKKAFASFFSFLEKENPQIIVATHFFPPILIEDIKSRLDAKVITVITDIRVHPLWVNQSVDFYLGAMQETKQDLIKLGVRDEQIITGCIPLRKGFQESLYKTTIPNKFYLSNRPSVLFVSSSRGNFPFLKDTLMELLDKFNVFIIYGRNRRLRIFLENIDSPHLRFFPFYEDIHELISVSSVIVTKPGGLTIFEGIYTHKFFIFTHYIPGQEKENMDLLISRGVGKFVKNKQEFLDCLHYFSKSEEHAVEDYPLKIANAGPILKSLIQEISDAQGS